MLLYQRAFERFQMMVGEWQGDQPLWIHIHGDEGAGKRHFIETLLDNALSDYHLLLHHDFNLLPPRSAPQAQHLVQSIFKTHDELYQRFLHPFPVRIRRMLHDQLHLRDDANRFNAEPPVWALRMLSHFIPFLGRSGRVLMVLENIYDNTPHVLDTLPEMASRAEGCPLLLITSGQAPLADPPVHLTVNELLLGKLSVLETEKMIAQQLRTRAINARLITNHLYIKSAGNQQRIRMMLEAYYRPQLDDLGNELIDGGHLDKIRTSGHPETLFRQAFAHLPEALRPLLGILARLDDPLPKPLFLELLEHLDIGKRPYRTWCERGFLEERSSLYGAYVLVPGARWKHYLRRHTRLETMAPLLGYLAECWDPSGHPVAVELSGLFYDAGMTDAAVAVAYKEARQFQHLGLYQRALDRYFFVRRNLTAAQDLAIDRVNLLADVADLQSHMGLYENAFDAYRELRDALKRDQRESWIRVSIRMANTLYQMDSLSEARYLLRDLKIKDSVSAYVLVFTHILLGELEENFGAPEYALRNYETAFARLSDADDETLSMRLFALMKKHFLERDERQRYLQLLHDSIAILPAGSAQQTGLRLEYLKLHIRPESIEAALQMALTMLRSGHPLSAAHYLQVRLYLADIYGYLGKWHLSRSCLRSLLANDILLPDALTRVAIMLNIGVVEKELGMYGSAMECLQEALELSRTERLLRQQYVIKAHLGHIYQLVYSYMRAHEYLTDTLAWAEEHRDDELLVRASLFLSAYELQHDRDDRARQYLERAAAALQLQNAPIDQLNLTYYQIVYALHQHDVESAAAQLERLSEAAHTIHKFDLLARWLNGRLQQETGQPEVARGALETALHLSRRYRLPQLEFQILRDLIDLSRQAAWWDDFNAFVSEAHAVHARLMRAVGDPILERQMKESKDYEAFIKATAR